MKQLLLLLTFTSSFIALSQEKLQLVTGISGFFEKELGMISNEGSQVYGGGGLHFGLRFIQDKGMLDATLVYQFSTNVFYYADADSVSFDGKYYHDYDSNGKEISSYKSLLRSHFIGASIKYIFRESDKTTRPFIKIDVLTELGSNFRDGYLLQDEYIPKLEPSATYFYSPIPGGEPKLLYYYSDLYYSTPLVSNLTAGIDIRLMQNLNLNIGVGYGFRIMKVKSVRWNEGEDYREKAKNLPTKSVYSHMFDFELGVSYAIPMKSGRKSKE
ncbi:MAG: hypothetical protein H3C31_10355 [Brumimicrobium sp.]|nr:hypothetical protein [Brumimicrobium sp.]